MKLVCDKITKSYRIGKEEPVPVLRGCSAVFEAGTLTAIVGVSGSGKSTLLDILSLVSEPDSGAVFIDGTDGKGLNRRRRASLMREKIGYLPQELGLLPILTVRENIRLPRLIAGRPEEASLFEKREDVLGIADCFDKFPHELSGGQCQRAAILRALANDPEILIADEPTSHLDSENTARFLSLLEALKKKGTTVILATHDERLAGCADKRLQLRDGRLI